MGLIMLWMAILGTILVWMNNTPSSLLVNAKSSQREGYQINPKPCWVDGKEGTCMFVYECIKSEGYHIGMCVDAFMFGSCCAHHHNHSGNSLLIQHQQQQQHQQPSSQKPQILYTQPSQPNYNNNNNNNNNKGTKKPVNKVTSSLTYYSNNNNHHQLRPTSRPAHLADSTHPVLLGGSVSVKPHLLMESSSMMMSVRPSFSSRQPTQPPRHSIRPMSTDSFSLSNSILSNNNNNNAPYTKPEKTNNNNNNYEINNNKPSSSSLGNVVGWQFSTEPGFITKIKKPITSYKPKPSYYKPTKKPISGISKYPGKPAKTTTTEKPVTTIITSSTTVKTTTNDDRDLDTESTEMTTLSNLLKDQISNKSECGVPHLFTKAQTRIVGGKNAVFGRWPWQVSVRRTSFFGFSSTHRCGGAILNKNWIATAGHCVDDLLISQIRIRVGEHDFSNAEEFLPYTERSVEKKIVHPKYNFFTYEYDLALLKLNKPLEFAAHIRPICLPATDNLLIGENATVTGWGRLSEGGILPTILQEVQVPIVSNDHCKTMFLKAGRQESIPEIFLCAGHVVGGQDSCQGDSGGPLQVKDRDGRFFLAGIISWGIGCAEANLPGVCTRISKFVPWILKYVT